MVSWEFKVKVLAKLWLIALNSSLLFKPSELFVLLGVKLIPPWIVEPPKANGFNMIVPISGKNQPYEPLFNDQPSVVTYAEVFFTPAETEIKLYIRPASVNTLFVVYCESSVNDIIADGPINLKVN